MKEEKLLKLENFPMIEPKEIDTKEDTFQRLMFIYSSALKDMENKIGQLKEQFEYLYNYNLIDHVSTRIKSPESIMKKMQRKNCEMTYQELIQNINDIAGIRIICNVKEDIFLVKELIKNFPNLKILKEKDYVTTPKKSGYSSYHLIIQSPINIANQIVYVKSEIQIRTKAMDFWASLEHDIKYKSNGKITPKISKELVKCAQIINKIDSQMSKLYKEA